MGIGQAKSFSAGEEYIDSGAKAVCVCVCVCMRSRLCRWFCFDSCAVSGGTSPSQGLNRVVANLPSHTCSTEVAAPPVCIVRNALALCFSATCLLARGEAGEFARRLPQVDLTSIRVTIGIRLDVYPSVICYGHDE